MSKVLIVYASRTGETQKIGELIGEGIRMAGHEATLVDVKAIKRKPISMGLTATSLDRPPIMGT